MPAHPVRVEAWHHSLPKKLAGLVLALATLAEICHLQYRSWLQDDISWWRHMAVVEVPTASLIRWGVLMHVDRRETCGLFPQNYWPTMRPSSSVAEYLVSAGRNWCEKKPTGSSSSFLITLRKPVMPRAEASVCNKPIRGCGDSVDRHVIQRIHRYWNSLDKVSVHMTLLGATLRVAAVNATDWCTCRGMNFP